MSAKSVKQHALRVLQAARRRKRMLQTQSTPGATMSYHRNFPTPGASIDYHQLLVTFGWEA